ncbi:MAG: DNA repair protein RecN [Flavobacteriales bacterium]
MLRSLHIRNYLLIEELDLDLRKGLSIITGETGSGKSILIGALGLAMGERADAGALRDPKKRCIIELQVDARDLDLQAWFETHELPYEHTTILRRQLDPGGRSRAFVNDVPVRLEDLRELGGYLIHIHSQHHTLLLNTPRFQLGLVDHVAGQQAQVQAYIHRYTELRSCNTELEALRAEASRAQSEADFLQFQLNELDEASLKADEQEALEQDLARAEHAEELIQALQVVDEGVVGDRGVLGILAQLRQTLARPARIDTGVKAVLERLDSVHIELKDIGLEAGGMAASIALDPAQAARMRDRLDLLLRLQQKHRVQNNAQLIGIQDELRVRCGTIASFSERIVELEKQEQTLFKTSKDLAQKLSKGRAKAVGPLGSNVEKLLQDLGMPHAVFAFEHRAVPCTMPADLGPNGVDSVRALFSANKDRAAAPLDKVASGGELSRVMLALISLAADSQGLPTVVFDEIDTGVSGEVADRVGSLMARMGDQRQVLAITHLPQIASKAHQHLLVTKRTVNDSVHTRITLLDEEQRVEAIAHMLSGRKLTKAALENARVLMGQG